uniref:Uncharacterized protein n=1 Tax=Steinernema glaseri TaxID=37863 RepID=A0A1I7YSY1_9BILA
MFHKTLNTITVASRQFPRHHGIFETLIVCLGMIFEYSNRVLPIPERVLYGISSLLLSDPVSSFKTPSLIKEDGNMLAKTALSRLRLKLSGTDLSELTQLTVEDQVSTLIDDHVNRRR